MSSFAASRVASLLSDLTRIQGRIADISRDEARIQGRIADATSRLHRASSVNSAQSLQRDIERAHSDLARLQNRKASEARDLARKQSDFASAQKSLMEEQQRELRKSIDAVRQLEGGSRNRSTSSMNLFRGMMATGPKDNQQEDLQKRYACFISHASEDKEDVARPLAEALRGLGHSIWYDEFTLRIGDSLRRTIDRGLAASQFGIVVLSPSFFSKNWPQYELDGMVAKENAGQRVILPLWHKVSKNEVLSFSPTLADRVALSTSLYTVAELASEIHKVLVDPKSGTQ